MTAADVLALLPLLLIAATSVAVMAAAAVGRNHTVAFGLTLAGLAASFCSIFFVDPRRVTMLLVMDNYALFFMALIAAASFAVALLAYGYLAKREGNKEEFYILLLVATLGAMVLAASSHFASLFLGLEVLSIALYALIAYFGDRPLPVEAGIKYLVLAGSSSAFLLFGIALVYADLGTMDFARIAHLLAIRSDRDLALLLSGVVLIITGVGFKLALVPFHMWTPDVYQGAPAPVTAFVATVSKGGMFALLLRYFNQSGANHFTSVLLVFSIIAIASMLRRKPPCALSEQCQAHPGLFLDRAHGLSAGCARCWRPHGRGRRGLLSGCLFRHDPGRIRCRHRSLRAAPRCGPAGRLPRPVLAQAHTRSGLHGHAAFARRHPADRRFSWQVLHRCRRRGCRSLVVDPDLGNYQYYRPFLLPANCGGVVSTTG